MASKLKVLRIASITDDLVCDELHQTAPASVSVGHRIDSELLVFGPQTPDHHALFEYGKDGAYTLVLPPWTGGVLSLRGRGTKVAELWRKQARRDPKGGSLRLRLDPTAKGKLVFGETALLFQFAPPAPPPRKDPFPDEYRARVFAGFTRFDLATLLSGLLILGPYFIWAATKPIDPTIEHEIDERFLRVMGIPPKQDVPEPEEKDDEEKLLAVEDEDKKKDKEPEIVEKMINPSKAFSKEAIAKARGVGVARVLGTYGGPGEGTVFDVIQSTENNLGELFAAGMTRVVDADGNEVSTFVPGGEGISALGSAVGTKGFDVSADGPEVAGLDKKERKISLKSSGADVDGDADKKAVQATIRNRMGALQSCYEKALRGNTGLSGKIVYTITISVMGTVTSVQVLDDSLQDEGVKSCTVAKIKGWRFPTTPGAEASSDVTFSVVFSGQ
ncbi:MAG: AgmX/PglI C-terminal domain-containing protein [Nannocystis sp.]|uniref:AgmX/PglI C-terminal domain-containing protein n=1 Tax=Nannocystis sp. TaxID=1962667 RepID=UPI002425FC9C|nr:AgmX/PglI C-terminal domain-containing protein [Nannocystis sp.]MBK9758248.1 AgmX/PglI C-terminal domain-containing protein [Nannocystis sp.]